MHLSWLKNLFRSSHPRKTQILDRIKKRQRLHKIFLLNTLSQKHHEEQPHQNTHRQTTGPTSLIISSQIRNTVSVQWIRKRSRKNIIQNRTRSTRIRIRRKSHRKSKLIPPKTQRNSQPRPLSQVPTLQKTRNRHQTWSKRNAEKNTHETHRGKQNGSNR